MVAMGVAQLASWSGLPESLLAAWAADQHTFSPPFEAVLRKFLGLTAARPLRTEAHMAAETAAIAERNHRTGPKYRTPGPLKRWCAENRTSLRQFAADFNAAGAKEKPPVHYSRQALDQWDQGAPCPPDASKIIKKLTGVTLV